MKRLMLFSLVLVLFYSAVDAKVIECEVCENVINQLSARVADDAKPEEIEAEFKEFCKTAKGRDEKFCYYVGGLETSATYIIPEMSKPMSWKMPAEKICREKLLKRDPQICDLKYEKQIDLDTVDLKKLKVKDLKKILNDWGEDTAALVEKSDYIRKIEELKPKYATKAGTKKPANTDL